ARFINAASSSAAQWIANSDDPETISKRAVDSFRAFLEGLRIRK
ncbi:TetR/AcrR family transcriptional regulator, partial [Rhizobium sp. BR5]